MTIAEIAPAQDLFSPWAEVYDEEPNPIVHLIDRYLRRMLPGVGGRHIVDVGCGTGRHLQQLASAGAASLHGVDPSAAMLRVARRKLPSTVRLSEAALPILPVESEAVDCVLASLVLGYVHDLPAAMAELARVVRCGGDLFLSDVHPKTADALGWTRGNEAVSFQTRHWPLADVEACAQAHGLMLVARILPKFGEPEYPLFAANGKDKAWQQAADYPAVYVLQLRKQEAAMQDATTLRAGGCALGPHELVAATVTVQRGKVHSVLCHAAAEGGREIDLSEYLLLPGLINAHDHLEFALFPKLGRGPYPDAATWARNIQAEDQDIIVQHRRVPLAVSLWWGALRNVLCGVTTVCHHNTLHAALLDPALPVHVLDRYGWSHSLSFPPFPEDGLRETGEAEPFFIHACEGTTPQAAEELQRLEVLGALDDRTVLIHGLALDRGGVALLNRRGAALVICPRSNAFLFERNHAVSLLRAVDCLLLGSDSPLTSAGDLLDEVRTVTTWGLSPEQIYRMITDLPARVLALSRGEGTLRVDACADLIGIRQRGGSPAALLGTLTWRDVELVLRRGEIVLASAEVYGRLPENVQHGLHPLRIADEVRFLRAPTVELLKAAEVVLGQGNVFLNGRRLARVEETYAG